jgi:thiosulfate reductase cytochrome b subunit
MFKTPPSELSVVHILALIRSNVFQAVANLWTVTVHALAAWLVLGSIATGLLYLVLVPVLCRMRDRFLPKTGEKSC